MRENQLLKTVAIMHGNHPHIYSRFVGGMFLLLWQELRRVAQYAEEIEMLYRLCGRSADTLFFCRS